MIDERCGRFNDGDFVGRKAIQAVFEKTWRGDPTFRKARFYLSEIVVLTIDSASVASVRAVLPSAIQLIAVQCYKADIGTGKLNETTFKNTSRTPARPDSHIQCHLSGFLGNALR